VCWELVDLVHTASVQPRSRHLQVMLLRVQEGCEAQLILGYTWHIKWKSLSLMWTAELSIVQAFTERERGRERDVDCDLVLTWLHNHCWLGSSNSGDRLFRIHGKESANVSSLKELLAWLTTSVLVSAERSVRVVMCRRYTDLSVMPSQ